MSSRASRRGIIAMAIAVLAFAPTFVAPSAIGSEQHHAGIVVQHGDGTVLVDCERFTDAEISGFKLLKKSRFKFKAADFGEGLGHGVCYIDGEGPKTKKTDECFSDPNGNFWAYWTQESDQTSPTGSEIGPDTRAVTDGDVDYWVWGQFGTTPAPVTFAQACPDS